MSGILSRIFKRRGSRSRKTITRAHLSLRKSSKERGKELERAVESSDALSMLKKRTPRRVPKNDKERIKLFEKWCAEMGIEYHPHMVIQREGCCNGLGVVATADISEGECVVTVPMTSVLACVNSDVRGLLKENEESLTSSWIPLLLTLAYEYSCKSCSKWYPYLSIVPNDLSPMPMMWEESVRETLLEGTAVNGWVSNDLANIERDYQTVVLPIVAKYPDIFKPGMQDVDVYKRYVGYVMSYSFTDEKAGLLGKTMLVPFVDIINHSSYNNVKLTFHPKHLKLVAVKDIHKGEEVMNTYGEHSNASLLHMYGFTEEDNAHVEVVIPCELVKQVFLERFCNPAHWDALLELDVFEEEYSVGSDGQPHQDLLILTHLLCSKAKSIKKFVQCLQPDSFQLLDDCSEEELAFLKRLAEHCLEQHPEEVSTAAPVACYGVKQNEMNAWRVALGQQNSLRALRARTT